MANNNQNSPVGYVSQVEGPAATEEGKPLKEGQSVFMDTRVETGKGGSLQIQFVNGSQMALGAGKVAKVCDYFQPDSIQPELEPAAKVTLAGDPSLDLPPPTAGLPESNVTKLPDDPTIDLPPPAAGNPGGGNGSSSIQGGVRVERLGRRGNIGTGFETEDVTPAVAGLRFDTGGLIPRAAAGSPLPTIAPTDHNGGNPLAANGHNTVWESGLLTAAATETATGTIIITASDGLASISVGGTTLTAAELATLSGAPRTINTGEGNLTLTGYNAGTGVLSYSYTLLAAQNQPGAGDSLDSIALMATDLNGDTGSGALLIQIVDDAPTAAADSNSITEDAAPNTVSGNVLPNDYIGADANANPVTPASVSLTYGSLVLNSDGSYTYTLNNANTTVNALKDGRSLTETYTYTLTDGDGDTSTAVLSLTINGHTDGDPTITPTDHNGGVPAGANGQNTVWEEGLVIAANTETTTGTIVISAPDGLASISVGGTTLTTAQLATLAGSPVTINTGEGSLTLTNFNAGTGVLDYSYTLLAAQNQPGATDSLDSIALSVTDMGGSTGSGILSVQIIDDTPTAQNDAATAVEAGGVANGTPGTNPVGNVLTNDDVGADANAAPVTPASVTLTYGSLALNSSGSYTYTLDNNNAAVQSLRTSAATLTDSYSYTLTDGDGDTTTATLTVTIQGANDAPVAVADTATAVEAGTSAGTNPTGNVLGNDTDVDSGDTKTLTAISGSGSGGAGIVGGVTTGTYGSLTVNADGSYTYTVDNANATVQALRTSANTLTDTFTYSMRDTAGATSTTTLTLTIQGANDAPVAVADTATAVEAGGVANGTPGTDPVGNVLTNDIDVDSGDSKTVTAIAGGTVGAARAGNYGSIILNADGSYTYTLNNANATVQALRTSANTLTDTFTYSMQDTAGATSTTTLTLTIQGANDAPVAVADTATAVEAGTSAGTNPTGNVLANDTDVDSGDTKVVTAISGSGGAGIVGGATTGTYGSLTVNADGSYTYTVDNANATVQALRTSANTLTDTFTYSMQDTAGATSTTTLTLTIQGADDAPTAVNDTATSVEAGGINNGTSGTNPTGNVLTNDSDPDSGDSISLAGITGGTLGGTTAGNYGSIVLNTNGSYTYTLNNNHADVQGLRTSADTLIDSFTYSIQDTNGATSTANLRITIQGANDTPVAVADTATAVETGTVLGTNPTGNVLANDTDVDSGDAKILTAISGSGGAGIVGGATTGTYGSLTVNADGSYTYTVDNANATVQALRTSANTLTDTFTYSMQDTAGATSTTTLTLTIQGADDAPIAVNDTATAVEAGGINNGTPGTNPTGNVLTNDSDPDSGDSISLTGITGGTLGGTTAGNYGSIVLNGDGTYTYTVNNANTDVQGLRTSADTLIDSFTYSIRDTAGATSTANLRVTVQGANDAPVAVADTAAAVSGAFMNGTNPTGNLLTNDTDADGSSDTKTVTAIAGGGGGGAGAIGGNTIGNYGTLALDAAGNYSYTVNNGNVTVQTLTSSAQSITDTFTYSMRDSDGATSSTTLTVTILGADTPLVLDLNADGVHSVGLDAGVVFDVNDDGIARETGWISPEDGLLVRDLNADGQINDGSELFGNGTADGQGGKTSDGFEALSLLDDNRDGVIDSLDGAFDELRVWQDRDTDGTTDEGELVSLESLGIQSLNLTYTTSDATENGNLHGLVGSYTSTDGQSHEMTDVFFATGASVSSEAHGAAGSLVPVLTDAVAVLATVLDAEDPVPVLTEVIPPLPPETDADARTAQTHTHLVLVIDTSASMGQVFNNSMETRLDRTCEAAQRLIDGFAATGEVDVKVITFNSCAQNLTGADWADAATAKDLLGTLAAGADDTRDYEIALEQAMTIETYPASPAGTQSALYFFSNGSPTAGDLENNADTWQAHVAAHIGQIEAFGLDGDPGTLGSLSRVSPNVHVIQDIDQLNTIVLGCVSSATDPIQPPETSAQAELHFHRSSSPDGMSTGTDADGARHAFEWDKAGIVALDETGITTWLNVSWSASPDAETLMASRNGVKLLSLEMTDLNHGGAFVVTQHVPLIDVESIRIPYRISGFDHDMAAGHMTLDIRDTKIASFPFNSAVNDNQAIADDLVQTIGAGEDGYFDGKGGVNTLLLGGTDTDILVFDSTDVATGGRAGVDTPVFEATLDFSSLARPGFEDIESLVLETNADTGQISLCDLIEITDGADNTLFVDGDGNNEVWVNFNNHAELADQQGLSDQGGYLGSLGGHSYSLYVDQDIDLHATVTP